MPAHVHIGTGKFGLGFVGYFSNNLSLSTAFLNRTPKIDSSRIRNEKLQMRREYLIDYYDTGERDTVRFECLEFFGGTQEHTDKSVGLIADENTKLVTTTVGESQLSEVAPLIAQGLQQRSNDRPLFIIACENGHRCSTQLGSQVKGILGSTEHAGIFVDCVVDQICNRINSSEELVAVSAENYREWIIADASEELTNYLCHSQIRFVPSEHLKFYEMRKLWLVNGFHLALAILGVTTVGGGTNTRIAEILERKGSDLADQVEGVQIELVDALVYKKGSIFRPDDLFEFVEQTKQRFKASPDSCERILRDALLSPERIAQITRDFGNNLGQNKRLSDVFSQHLYECVFSFFKKVQDRLYEPVLINSDRDKSVYLPYVLMQLVPFLVKQGKHLISDDASAEDIL